MSKKLLQLIKDNIDHAANPVLIISNADTDEPTIFLYDVIDEYWGVSAADFNKELMAFKGKTVHLRINSPGGSVFEAEAMAAMIREHGNVLAHIDGWAASAATRVATAAKSVAISAQGFFMIHNAWTLAYGNKHELRETASLLDKIDTTIVADYARKTDKSTQEIVAWMDAETWFTAEEALEHGFVDSIANEESKEAKSKAKNWNLSVFENAPKALTETPNEPEPTIHDLQIQQIARNQNRMRLLENT